jgi:peptidyl-prolyl cis-trans isomerase B (cyclophilin B)
MIRPRSRFFALALGAGLALAACTSAGVPTVPPVSSGASPGASPAASTAASGGLAGCPTSQPAPLAAGQTRTVTITTSKGGIVIKVEGSLGPNAAGNFVALATCGYYDDVVFHRLVPGFVIQGGDGQYGREPSVDSTLVGRGGPGYQFADDPVTVGYTRGTVAMANSGPDTNGSQFFICLVDLSSDQLPPSYSVFGHVTSGMDVVDAIATMPNSGGQANTALQPVAMTKVTVSNP